MHTFVYEDINRRLDCINVFSNTECADSGFLLNNQLGCLLNLSAEKVLQAVPWNMWKNLHFYRLPLKTERSAIIAVVDGRQSTCT